MTWAAQTNVLVRPIEPRDRGVVLEIARELVRSADTYAFDPEITDDELWAFWAPAEPARGYVAEVDGSVLGMFMMRPNQQGPGSHVANAGYAVHSDARGRGIGRQMAEESLEIANDLGYEAMQFNIVVSTNVGAIRLWKSLGFRIIGTIPEGFRMPDGRLVDFHVMHRKLGG